MVQHPELQVKDVAEALDVHPFMLSKWTKDYREGRIVDTQGKKPKIDMASKDKASRLTPIVAIDWRVLSRSPS